MCLTVRPVVLMKASDHCDGSIVSAVCGCDPLSSSKSHGEYRDRLRNPNTHSYRRSTKWVQLWTSCTFIIDFVWRTICKQFLLKDKEKNLYWIKFQIKRKCTVIVLDKRSLLKLWISLTKEFFGFQQDGSIKESAQGLKVNRRNPLLDGLEIRHQRLFC